MKKTKLIQDFKIGPKFLQDCKDLVSNKKIQNIYIKSCLKKGVHLSAIKEDIQKIKLALEEYEKNQFLN